jgi:DNA-binding response OmpR family regulator
MLSDCLADKRLAVAHAHNLDEALAELDRERRDVVLLDVRLGETDGLEALSRIREVNMTRFAQNQGDLTPETAARRAGHMARARRSVGLS